VQRLGDLLEVPARPVLVGQQHQLAVDDPGVAPRVLEQHQGEHGVEVAARHGGHQVAQHTDESHGLARLDGSHDVGSAARGVSGGEGEVGDVGHRVHPGLERPAGRHTERLAGHLLPGARQPGGHRRARHQEQAGDVGGRHSEDQPQVCRHLGSSVVAMLSWG